MGVQVMQAELIDQRLLDLLVQDRESDQVSISRPRNLKNFGM